MIIDIYMYVCQYVDMSICQYVLYGDTSSDFAGLEFRFVWVLFYFCLFIWGF